jgi:nickel superoxide dismutase
MKLFNVTTVYAHCDLPCGVYDPAQARIEAESVLAIMQRYQQHLDDEVYKTRAIIIKEERAELANRHLWVLWTDYFKPEHLAAHPDLHDLFWRATKAAGECKHSVDPANGEKLLALIDEVAIVFAATKAAK